jgi:hypothetical protein
VAQLLKTAGLPAVMAKRGCVKLKLAANMYSKDALLVARHVPREMLGLLRFARLMARKWKPQIQEVACLLAATQNVQLHRQQNVMHNVVCPRNLKILDMCMILF